MSQLNALHAELTQVGCLLKNLGYKKVDRTGDLKDINIVWISDFPGGKKVVSSLSKDSRNLVCQTEAECDRISSLTTHGISDELLEVSAPQSSCLTSGSSSDCAREELQALSTSLQDFLRQAEFLNRVESSLQLELQLLEGSLSNSRKSDTTCQSDEFVEDEINHIRSFSSLVYKFSTIAVSQFGGTGYTSYEDSEDSFNQHVALDFEDTQDGAGFESNFCISENISGRCKSSASRVSRDKSDLNMRPVTLCCVEKILSELTEVSHQRELGKFEKRPYFPDMREILDFDEVFRTKKFEIVELDDELASYSVCDVQEAQFLDTILRQLGFSVRICNSIQSFQSQYCRHKVLEIYVRDFVEFYQRCTTFIANCINGLSLNLHSFPSINIEPIKPSFLICLYSLLHVDTEDNTALRSKIKTSGSCIASDNKLVCQSTVSEIRLLYTYVSASIQARLKQISFGRPTQLQGNVAKILAQLQDCERDLIQQYRQHNEKNSDFNIFVKFCLNKPKLGLIFNEC
eukprot:276844_1